MEILRIEMFRDGGTIEVTTDNGVYCIYDGFNHTYEGKVFNGYPNDDFLNQHTNQEQIQNEILESLKTFNPKNTPALYLTKLKNLLMNKARMDFRVDLKIKAKAIHRQKEIGCNTLTDYIIYLINKDSE